VSSTGEAPENDEFVEEDFDFEDGEEGGS